VLIERNDRLAGAETAAARSPARPRLSRSAPRACAIMWIARQRSHGCTWPSRHGPRSRDRQPAL